MVGRCHRPTLIIEGPGDSAALPPLIRKICEDNNIHDLWPVRNPIMRQNIPKLSRIGELEQYVRYGLLGEGDGVLVILDTDGDCPGRVVDVWIPRIQAMLPLEKRVGLVFFRSEFESLFLYCLDRIAERYPEYGWNMDGWELVV